MGKRVTDLTILYYTANRLNPFFASTVKTQLVQAAAEIPIISISHKPISFGSPNICVGSEVYSSMQIYRQILLGAKAAQTQYVAMAEDDVLYSREHFQDYFRGPHMSDEFAYDFSRWSVYTWSRPPVYSLKVRRSMTTLICPRDLLIEALEERFEKYPTEGSLENLELFSEFGKYEKQLGVTPRKSVEYRATVPCIVFSHEEALGYTILQNRKRLGELKAYDIPYWGKVEEVIKKYYGKDVSEGQGTSSNSYSPLSESSRQN